MGSLVCNPDGSDPDLLLHLQPKSIKEDAVIAFLADLHRSVPGPLMVLWDHLQAHRSQKVAEYLGQNRDWLRVEWFPYYAPELNPMENVWEYPRQNKLCALVWDTYETIVQACRDAWKFLVDDPARIQSIGIREWACVDV